MANSSKLIGRKHCEDCWYLLWLLNISLVLIIIREGAKQTNTTLVQMFLYPIILKHVKQRLDVRESMCSNWFHPQLQLFISDVIAKCAFNCEHLERRQEKRYTACSKRLVFLVAFSKILNFRFVLMIMHDNWIRSS